MPEAVRRQMGVAPSQPSVAVASGVREALLQRLRSRGRKLQAERLAFPPWAREVDDSEDSTGYRVVYRRTRAGPPMVSLIEVLGGEHLQGVIGCEYGPDAVRSGRGFAVLGAFDEIHLGGPSSQRVRTFDVQEQPRGIAYNDQALGLCDWQRKSFFGLWCSVWQRRQI